MLKKIITTISFSLSAFTAHAYTIVGEVGAGYRQDYLNWNIDGGASGPNILSELKWKDLQMINYYGQLRLTLPIISFIRVTGNYGTVFSGKNTDWDYHGDNRTDPFGYAVSNAGKGEAFEISGAWGRAFSGLIPGTTIIPLVGYSLQEQHLRFYDGLQVFYYDTENSLMPDLASNYRAKWYTPFVGLDLIITPSDRFELYTTAEWHTGTYRGTGFWNLRTDFLSELRHHAYLDGVVLRLQANYKWNSRLTTGILGEHINMITGKGINQVDINGPIYDAFGDLIDFGPVTAQGGLNKVQWGSWRILLTSRFNF